MRARSRRPSCDGGRRGATLAASVLLAACGPSTAPAAVSPPEAPGAARPVEAPLPAAEHHAVGGAAVSPAARAGSALDGPEAAALRFFEEETRPRLRRVADGGSAARYRFGAPEYIRWALALTPRVTAEPHTGASLRRRYFEGMPRGLVDATALVGEASALPDDAPCTAVLIELRDDGTPADGGMVLVHVVAGTPPRVVLVFRLLQG